LHFAVGTFLRGQPWNDEWKGFWASLGFAYKRPSIYIKNKNIKDTFAFVCTVDLSTQPGHTDNIIALKNGYHGKKKSLVETARSIPTSKCDGFAL
jgi:hypothetical protein